MLPEKWVVKISTQEEWDLVLEKTDSQAVGEDEFELEDGDTWKGIDYHDDCASSGYYNDNSEYSIVSFDDFMSQYIPVPKEEKWVVACKTQEEWDAVLDRIDADVESSMFDFNDDEDWQGYGVDSDGKWCDIKDYISDYPRYRIISAYEFLSTGLIRNNYSIF